MNRGHPNIPACPLLWKANKKTGSGNRLMGGGWGLGGKGKAKGLKSRNR